MALEVPKTSILAPFWKPSWGWKTKKLAPRGFLGCGKVIFEGIPKGFENLKGKKVAWRNAETGKERARAAGGPL